MKRVGLLNYTLGIVLIGLVSAACGGEDGPVSIIPDDYRSTFTEVRNCRANGGSHDFRRIRVLAGPEALAPYRDRAEPFPPGALVLKEEYAPEDENCSGEVESFTVMEKLPEGNEETLGWRWQRVAADGVAESEDEARCIGCHSACVPPDGYDGTCTVP